MLIQLMPQSCYGHYSGEEHLKVNLFYGDAQSRLQNVDHLYTCVLQKKKKKKKKHPITIPHLYD